MLYDRDYRILTKEEKNKWQKAENRLNSVSSKDGSYFVSLDHLSKYWEDLPEAVVFHRTLFPNNYIHSSIEHKDTAKTQRIIKAFEKLLDKGVTEREIVNFIKEKKGYFLIRDAIFQRFATGHHGSYIFREFELPPNYIADYLLVGKSSGGYEFIFVEFENVVKNITTKSGDLGASIRKGLQQVEDWSTWLDANFSHLKLLFEKHKNSNVELPDEFIALDKSRIHFAVVAGRRSDFNDKTYRLARKHRKNNIQILHYDNLIDSANSTRNDVLKLKKKTDKFIDK